MTIEASRAVIISEFKTKFDDANPSIPVKYPNHKFVQPDTTWAAIVILGGTSQQANLGVKNVTERHVGLVQIDIMVPEDEGTKEGGELAQAAGAIFSRQQFSAGTSSLTFQTPEIKPIGDDGGFDRTMVRIEFRRDEKT